MGSSSLFLAEDKLREKADYHEWKMSIDLTLKNQGVLDHVRGNIVEPPSNASAAAWNKWKIEEVKIEDHPGLYRLALGALHLLTRHLQGNLQ